MAVLLFILTSNHWFWRDLGGWWVWVGMLEQLSRDKLKKLGDWDC